MATIPVPPRSLKAGGRRLWRSVLREFDLAEHELTLLRNACRVADVCDELQAVVDREGPIVADRANPALVELRQQRILLARLLVALRVPLGEDQQPRPAQHRGLRGVYQFGEVG